MLSDLAGAESDHLLNTGLKLGIDSTEGGAMNIVEHNGWTVFGALVAKGDIVDMQPFDMTGIEAVGRLFCC